MSQEHNPIARQMRVSPKYLVEKVRADGFLGLVDIYLDRISGWMIEPSRHILGKPFDVIPALTLALPYFETSASYWDGTNSTRSSMRHFVKGFMSVIRTSTRTSDINPELSDELIYRKLAEKFYDAARCGLLHTLALREGILLATATSLAREGISRQGTDPMIVHEVERETGAPGNIWIAVDRLIDSIEGHAMMHARLLRDGGELELRRKFIVAWNINNPGLSVPNDFWRP